MRLKGAVHKRYDLPTRRSDQSLSRDRSKHMSTRLKFNSLLIGMLLLAICAAADAQKGENYKVRLSTVPVDATMLSRVVGARSREGLLEGYRLTLRQTLCA